MHVFGLGEKPPKHEEKCTHTGQRWELNPQPQRFEANVLTPVPSTYKYSSINKYNGLQGGVFLSYFYGQVC